MEQPGQHEAPPPPPTAFGQRRVGGSERWSYVGWAVLLGSLAIGVYLGGRALAGYLATKAPYSIDQSIGSVAKEQFLTGSTQCTNPVVLDAVREITDRLTSGLDPEFQEVEVYVLEDENVNAFALPGGYVFVLTGLLNELQSPEELVGVLGHELGHVVERHGIQRLAQNVWFRIILLTVVGDVSGIGDIIAVQGISLAERSFDRGQENESDEFGLELMRKVGYKPDDGGGLEFLSTHPDSEERAAGLREKIKQGHSPANPIAPPSLDRLKAPCHLPAEPSPLPPPVGVP